MHNRILHLCRSTLLETEQSYSASTHRLEGPSELHSYRP